MNQAQIERHVGIDQIIADHIMRGETPAAKSAMNLLSIQVKSADPCGLALLKLAVDDCRLELRAQA